MFPSTASEVGENSRVEVDGVFKNEWAGKKNIPFTDLKEIDAYIDSNLSEEALLQRLRK